MLLQGCFKVILEVRNKMSIVVSGKTSLLRVIAGLEDVTSGKVYFDGEWACVTCPFFCMDTNV